MTIITIFNKQYTGAGVLITEDYYTKQGEIIPCLILCRNKSSLIYMDMGGAYESKHQSLNVTASKELREESANLFNINPIHLSVFQDIPTSGSNKTFYRIYIIKINGVARKYYNHNKHLLDSSSIPRSWRETDQIAHIPIQGINFTALTQRKKHIIKDIDNNDIQIHPRVKNILINSKSLISDTIKSKPLAKKKDIQIYKSKDFLNGTYCYNLS